MTFLFSIQGFVGLRFYFMACFHPLQAFQSNRLNVLGKSSILFTIQSWEKAFYKAIQLPCGQCVGCRLERSRQWAIRCLHESKLYKDNCFITLTFDDANLPNDRSLDVKYFQDFIKRLREFLVLNVYKSFSEKVRALVPRKELIKYARTLAPKVRYYHCGEYGDRFGRPHYHAIMFNIDFHDKYLFKVNNGHRLYRSPTLERLWTFGHSSIGNVTFESAAYCARYIMKKKLGKGSWMSYADIDFETGEVLSERKKEYTTMSRRSGIGKGWFDKYLEDVYPNDNVVVNGRKMRPPRYYDSLYEIKYSSDFRLIKQQRLLNAALFSENNTPERLLVREQCQLSRISRLPRLLE